MSLVGRSAVKRKPRCQSTPPRHNDPGEIFSFKPQPDSSILYPYKFRQEYIIRLVSLIDMRLRSKWFSCCGIDSSFSPLPERTDVRSSTLEPLGKMDYTVLLVCCRILALL